MEEPVDIAAHMDVADKIVASLWRRFRFVIDKEDLRGEVYLAFVACARSYEPGHIPFKAWAWWKCKRLVIDALRSQHIIRSHHDRKPLPQHWSLDVVAAISVPDDCDSDLENRVDDLLACIAPSVRKLVWLHHGFGLTLAEVGKIVGLRPETVAVKTRHAVRIIRKRYGIGKKDVDAETG